MATGSAGSLTVSLGLDAAEYTSGLTKAEYQAKKFSESLGNGVRSAGLLAAAGVTLLASGAITALTAIDQLAKKAGDFQDLAEVTGGSAEGMASLGVAAGTAGTSFEQISKASVTLTKNLTGVDDESKAAGAAVAALGLNLGDFKNLRPEDQISQASKALGGFADGAEKSAVATALFGRSGAELLPFLKALDEQGGRQVILTEKQIALADDYSDRQAKLNAEIGQYVQLLATQALPAVSAFTGALADTLAEIVGVDKGTASLSANDGVADFAEKAARALAFLIDGGDGVVRVFQVLGTTIGAAAAQLAALGTGEFKRAQQIGKDYLSTVDDILNRETFGSKLNRRLEQQKKDADSPATKDDRPTLKFNGAITDKGTASAKKSLDNVLKMYQDAVAQEEDILQSRNKMLDLYNGANLISTVDYYNGKRTAQSEAVSAQVKLYDQEIAALQAYQSKTKKSEDKVSTQGKINDLLEKKAKLTRDAGQAALEMGFAETKAAEDFQRQINSVNADVLELTGNLEAAARIRLGDQFKDLRARASANGDAGALAQIDQLEKYKIAQAGVGQQTEQISQITENLRIQEERIALSRQLGADTELSSLVKLGEARSQAVEQMRSMVEAQEAIARASGNPVLIQNAEKARVALEQLAASANPLADKFNTIFSDSFGNAFGDFISGTASAKDAFDAFTQSVMSQLAKIAAQNITDNLFGGLLNSGGGTGGGIGGFLANLFGGGKAVGGTAQSGMMYQVNERGPELLDVNGRQMLMMGSKSGKITPNSKLGGGQSIIVQVSPPANSSRQTALQWGEAAGRQISVSSRRNS